MIRAALWVTVGLYLNISMVVLGRTQLSAQELVDQPTTAQRFDGLGSHSREISTDVPEAQIYFDQGLAFLFAFNHDEALRSFRHAAELDSRSAMANWGIAIANGPHINNPVVTAEESQEAWKAIQNAEMLGSTASEVEQALIAAQLQRYSVEPPEDRRELDVAYANAMRSVHARFPQDADVAALFAEALMDLRPWDLWTPEGEPQPGTLEIIAVLERALQLDPAHPLALHLYIHAVEASPDPGRADDEAERLRTVAPGLGHLVHMPSHIDIRRGRWAQAVASNKQAIAADLQYRRLAPPQGFYRIYMAHNLHMLSFASLMQGQSRQSLESIQTLLAAIPQDWLQDPANAKIVDSYFAMPIEILVRFGRWDEVLAYPEPASMFPVARCLRLAARATALGALRRVPEARTEQSAFRERIKGVPDDAVVGNNSAAEIFTVVDLLLEGELLAHEERFSESIAMLQRAAAAEDDLTYDEPPDWILPVRHALGAVLLDAHQPAEAEQAYLEDLEHWPENGWSLIGLERSLRIQGKLEQADDALRRFQKTWQHADVQLKSSCFCR